MPDYKQYRIFSIYLRYISCLDNGIHFYPLSFLFIEFRILCMKGLEADSGKRLSQVFGEEVGKNINIAVWVGPGHVQDFVDNIPNCMVIGSENIEVTKK
jgi:hypothetical protein